MKNSALYASKVKKAILSDAARPPEFEASDPVRLLILAVLEEDATVQQARQAMTAIDEEFVDHNELRVAPAKDLVDCLGRDFPGVREKAVGLPRSLHAAFEHCNAVLVEYLAKKPKREIRKVLREELGLSLYAESVLTLLAFDGHAVPVDELLLEAMKLDELIHPDSDLPDLQGFLERIISSKDAKAAHAALRAYAEKNAPRVWKELQRRRKIKEEAEAKARAQEEARLKAEAEAKAEAERKDREKAEKAELAIKAKAARAKAKARAAKKTARAKKARKARKELKSAKAAKTARPAIKGRTARQPAAKKKK